MPKKSNVCEHGLLRRSCGHCDALEEIAELERQLAAVRAEKADELKFLNDVMSDLKKDAEEKRRKAAALDLIFSDAEVAYRLSCHVHNRCQNVPHDIGLTLVEVIRSYVESLKQQIEAE